VYADYINFLVHWTTRYQLYKL